MLGADDGGVTRMRAVALALFGLGSSSQRRSQSSRGVSGGSRDSSIANVADWPVSYAELEPNTL